MATRLRDLMHDKPASGFHALFPGRRADEVAEERQLFVKAFIPDMVQIMEDHLNRLPVPEFGQSVCAQVLPWDFFHILADKIDEALPHWNLVQRAALYEVCSSSLWDEATEEWNRMYERKVAKAETPKDFNRIMHGN